MRCKVAHWLGRDQPWHRRAAWARNHECKVQHSIDTVRQKDRAALVMAQAPTLAGEGDKIAVRAVIAPAAQTDQVSNGVKPGSALCIVLW